MTNPNDESKALRITRELPNQSGADGAPTNVTADDANTCNSVPLSLVKKSSESETATKKSIKTYQNRSLWDLLTDDCPENLEELCVRFGGDFPCDLSIPRNPGSTSHLTSFEFISLKADVAVSLGQHLLEFLRNCPKLEVLFLSYCDPTQAIRFKTGLKPAELIHLDYLHSFTHESYSDTVPTDLFNRLCLKLTCNITFTIRCRPGYSWDRSFSPPLDDTSHLSCAHKVTITVRPDPDIEGLVIVGAIFSNPHHAFSVNAIILPHRRHPADGIKNILGLLKKCEDVQTLHFEHCIDGQNVKTVLKRVEKIVVKRWKQGTPLKFVVLDVQSKEMFEKQHRKWIKKLKRKSVTVKVKDSKGESECSTIVGSSTGGILIHQ